MNEKLKNTSKIFESIIRIQMMASLSITDLTYKQLKEICQISDGNTVSYTHLDVYKRQ